MLDLDALVFDMDGVLIDVSESYRAAIRETTRVYFEDGLRLAPFAGELVSRQDVNAFKFAGGFNNDWDLTTALVKYFLALLDFLPPPSSRGEGRGGRDLLAFLRDAGSRVNTTVESLAQHKDIAGFTRQVKQAGGGLAAVSKILGTRGDDLLFAAGDPRATNLVKRIFEEMYLGTELFRAEYGESPLLHHGDGLIRREKLIPSRQTLLASSERLPLGIATGRPHNQAAFALRAAGIETCFRALVTHDDLVRAEEEHFAATGERVSFGKPHPFTLLQAARQIAPENSRCAYVGDTLDDMRAAKAAGFFAIGCLAPAEDKDQMRGELARAGADMVVESPDELAEIVSRQTKE